MNFEKRMEQMRKAARKQYKKRKNKPRTKLEDWPWKHLKSVDNSEDNKE